MPQDLFRDAASGAGPAVVGHEQGIPIQEIESMQSLDRQGELKRGVFQSFGDTQLNIKGHVLSHLIIGAPLGPHVSEQ